MKALIAQDGTITLDMAREDQKRLRSRWLRSLPLLARVFDERLRPALNRFVDLVMADLRRGER